MTHMSAEVLSVAAELNPLEVVDREVAAERSEFLGHRGDLARRLTGAGRELSPDRDAVAELVAERAAEG